VVKPCPWSMVTGTACVCASQYRRVVPGVLLLRGETVAVQIHAWDFLSSLRTLVASQALPRLFPADGKSAS